MVEESVMSIANGGGDRSLGERASDADCISAAIPDEKLAGEMQCMKARFHLK